MEACPWVGNSTTYRVIVYLKAHIPFHHIPPPFRRTHGTAAWRATLSNA
ncbi:MAG: hypothetical protein IJK42_06460 [Prevotella sp.]|nr:hypothetical protein [Prevotella sp.]MBQ6209397.1 hypothetical protein [Prevotella sp.]